MLIRVEHGNFNNLGAWIYTIYPQVFEVSIEKDLRKRGQTDWVSLDIFSLIYHFSSLSPSIWETARHRLKYCLKGPLNPKQPTNQCLPEK